MDAGTAFGGIGAARIMTTGTLAEPALGLVIFALGLLAGSTNLDVIAALQQEGDADWHIATGLALLATGLVAIADGAGSPRAGSEPTMRRAAMALEHSGRDLAVIDMTEALRLLVWLNLIVAMFLPFGIAPAGAGPAALVLGVVVWAAKLLVLAAALALLHTVVGRMRLTAVPRLLGVAVLLGLLAVVFMFAGAGTV
jgi:formate hydrogenlyase subunit 4